MFGNLLSKLKSEKYDVLNQSVVFNSIMDFSKIILESQYPERIFDVIYILGKPKQINRILDSLSNVRQDNHDCGEQELFISGNALDYQYFFNKPDNVETLETSILEISPSTHLVFTYPWDQERLLDAFLSVGEAVDNKWEHDTSNHIVTLIAPLNIAMIANGNHSAAMNIISNESLFRVKYILELFPVYQEIYTDGIDFKYRSNDIFIEKVTSVEMAAIFEIGRLIQEHSSVGFPNGRVLKEK